MKVAIVGSRTFKNPLVFIQGLKSIGYGDWNITTVISGDAKGTDTLAREWAHQHHIPYIGFKPDWDKYKKAAGYIRNRLIVEAAEIVIAFWDGKSLGTAHTITIAKERNKQILIIPIIV